jgi:carbonic anhydrase
LIFDYNKKEGVMKKRRVITRTALALAALAVGCGPALASGSPGITADLALQKLMEGNKNYVEQKMTNQNMSSSKVRESLADGQKPYAVILSCSDSRVPPEIVFDKGLGEIFIIRVAGNVADPIVLGSIEYAVEHLGTPLVMVLGHERCGAVTAAVEANGRGEGNIGAIVKAIAPAVASAKKENKAGDKASLIETAVDDNIRIVEADLMRKSYIISHLVTEGRVKIVGAKYDLDDGKVSLIK